MKIIHLSIIIISVIAISGCAGNMNARSTASIENATYAYNTISNGNLVRVDVICPLNGEEFESTDWKSGSSDALRLDFKRLGRFPQPILLPVCPESKFVVYKNSFSDEEIKRLNQYINSPEYHAIRDIHVAYYRLAETYKYIGVNDLRIADAYLKATWQLHDDDKRYRDYALNAIKHFKLALNESKPIDFKTHSIEIQKTGYSYSIINILIGELYRRAGLFERSIEHLTNLESDSYILNKFPDDMRVIDFILKSAKSHDMRPYTLADVKESNRNL